MTHSCNIYVRFSQIQPHVIIQDNIRPLHMHAGRIQACMNHIIADSISDKMQPYQSSTLCANMHFTNLHFKQFCIFANVYFIDFASLRQYSNFNMNCFVSSSLSIGMSRTYLLKSYHVCVTFI